MILDRVEIVNFRSIKEENVRFDNKGLILIGKNEAGKTNILKAIDAVFGEYKVSDKDKRKRIDNEKIEKSYVRGILKLSESDRVNLKKKLEASFDNLNLVVFENGKSLDEYIDINFNEFIIQIDIKNDEAKHFAYWKIDENRNFTFKDKIYLLQDGRTLVKEPTSQVFDLEANCFEKCMEIYKEDPYVCHYWKYSTKYLIPHSISISDFRKNPTICIPLYNIFLLCNREDVDKEFDEALSEDGDYANLLEQISAQTTKTFRNIWKDFKILK